MLIILGGWVEWNLVCILGYELHSMLLQYVMLQHGFGLANVVGILALVYGTTLALTSNDRSQRYLGGAVWKFLQQGAYVLWALVLLHTVDFLYLHFQDLTVRRPSRTSYTLCFAGDLGRGSAIRGLLVYLALKAKAAAPTPMRAR